MTRFTLAEICEWSGAVPANAEEVQGGARSAERALEGLAPLREAGPSDLAFFFSKAYEDDLRGTRAGVILTGDAFVAPLKASGLPQWKSTLFLSCPDPYSAMAKVTREISRRVSCHDHQRNPESTRIHSTAVVEPDVKLGEKVQIGAHVVIEAGAEIGDGAVLYPRVYVGRSARIGRGSVLFPGVTLYEGTAIGERCRIHAGAVLGSDGFGYAPRKDPATGLTVEHQKIWHLGRVVVGNDVEIGSNTTIDRGTLGDTVIHDGVKIDNQVQVGHNVVLCRGAVLCGCSGIAGSSTVGEFAIIGAQAGVGNHVRIGAHSVLAGYAGATKDIPDHSFVAGVPARPQSEHFKILALQQRLLKERGKKK